MSKTLTRREQAIQTSIMKYLKKRGAYTVKVVSATRRGVSDTLNCVPMKRKCILKLLETQDTIGVFVSIEVKDPLVRNHRDGGASKLQLVNLRKTKAAGGVALLAYSKEEVENALREV